MLLYMFLIGLLNLSTSSTDLCPMVTITCSAMDLSSTVLRWFLNDDLFAIYPLLSHMYPYRVHPENMTFSTLLGGVDIQILSASLNENNRDSANFLSNMTVYNISALKSAGISSISCGSLGRRTSVGIEFDSTRGQFGKYWCCCWSYHSIWYQSSYNVIVATFPKLNKQLQTHL